MTNDGHCMTIRFAAFDTGLAALRLPQATRRELTDTAGLSQVGRAERDSPSMAHCELSR